MKIAATVLLLIAFSFQISATPPPPLQSTAAKFLLLQNQARAAVNVPSVKWSETLSNATARVVRYQRIKMSCQFANLSTSQYGANQLWVGGGASITPPRDVVGEWVGEKKYYNYANNSCVGNNRCGVYTQIVWRKSMEVGCAQGLCVKEKASLTVCFYNPPGNFNGERPY